MDFRYGCRCSGKESSILSSIALITIAKFKLNCFKNVNLRVGACSFCNWFSSVKCTAYGLVHFKKSTKAYLHLSKLCCNNRNPCRNVEESKVRYLLPKYNRKLFWGKKTLVKYKFLKNVLYYRAPLYLIHIQA